MISQTITTPQGNQHCANPSSVKSLPRLPIDPDVTLTSRHLAQRLLIGQEIVLVTFGVLMRTIVCHIALTLKEASQGYVLPA